MKTLFGIIAGMKVVLRHVVGAMQGVMVVTVSVQICVRFVLPKVGNHRCGALDERIGALPSWSGASSSARPSPPGRAR